MHIESSQHIYSISAMHQLCKQQKKQHEGEPEKQLCSFLGAIVDCSNHIAGYQKIFVIDDSFQKSPLTVLLRGDQRESFVTNVKIGDIVYFRYFQVAYFQGELMALKSEDLEQSKFEMFPIKRDENSENMQNQTVNPCVQLGLKQRIQILLKFSFNYFRNKELSLVGQTEMIQENPQNEEEKKSCNAGNKNMIVRVVDTQQHNNSYYVKMTDQHQTFIMKFHKKVETGVYLLRAYAKMKEGNAYTQIQTNSYTNLLQISPWMRSFEISQRVHMDKERDITRFAISTKILREDVPRMSLQSLRQSDEHLRDIRVKCEIMDVATPFQNMFKRLVVKKKGKRYEYEEFNWDHPQGQLVLNVHLYISDPTLNGQIMNVYLYSFDGKGNEFIPGFDMRKVQEMLLTNRELVERQYNQFVNVVLQLSSYQKHPLQLLLSPLSNRKLGTVYRIVDTVLTFQ